MTEHTTADAPEPEPTAVPEGAAAAKAPAAPKDRRVLFAVLRWTAAVLVFGTVGAGVAYGISRPERTDVPGLSTESDGRWAYPALARPTLPPGAPLPFSKENRDGIHYAGLTQLLLPAPAGSTPDATLKLEKDSEVTADTFLEEYETEPRDSLRKDFAADTPREIVARGWTMPDGTRTRVYLLRFHSAGFTSSVHACPGVLKGVNSLPLDVDWTKASTSLPTSENKIAVHKEGEPVGDEQTAVGCIQSGDIEAVILQTRKGGVASVPLHQTVILQHQLLG
ncbi:hypothetical protein [Streptomyces sp. NBC_01408]|uniref:hypothetical protein n=1 Tax=Streptomyces sp. NBC_01408 TaxID=2903855 RepID=UPI00225A4DA7|nr:hypothetical protein [Streptomyces sp. NBC_01408]MCX4691941.1 hypothetical protein [Streptomyces sp. NBC_01408]